MDNCIDVHDAVVMAGDFPLLSGVTLSVPCGALVVLSGPNGAGKTSLLRLIAGLEQLTQGSGQVAGIDLVTGDRRQLRRRVGWLGHEGSFYGDLTVRENLLFAAQALGRPRVDVDAAISMVDLDHRRDVVTKLLSAGQRRRLGLAWLIVRRPEIWLLDEPYAALDASGKTFFDGLIEGALAGGATVIVSAHDPLTRGATTPLEVSLAGGRVVSS